jgi:phytoene dehydrogenase-like protein
MKTGWPLRPSRLSQRKEEDNNLLFETWTSNVGKLDMEQASCDALRADVPSIRLSRPHLYNPSMAPSAGRSTEVEIEDLTTEDVSAQSLVLSIEVDATANAEKEDDEAAQVEEEVVAGPSGSTAMDVDDDDDEEEEEDEE